jgi:hypothetical protein
MDNMREQCARLDDSCALSSVLGSSIEGELRYGGEVPDFSLLVGREVKSRARVIHVKVAQSSLK